MRLFIALDLPQEVKRAAQAVQAELKPCGADVKWVAPANMHLTLKFLGEAEESLLPDIKQGLAGTCAECPALELGVSGCGAFPTKGKPSVVWLGLTGELERLQGLAAAIEAAMAGLGFEPEDRPFKPHLTLGRVRRPRGKKSASADAGPGAMELKRTLAGLRAYKGPDFQANHVILMMSSLTPSGPIYKPLQTLELI